MMAFDADRLVGIYAPVGLDTETIVAFLVTFSRFEYSLKRARFTMPNKKAAEADWDAFARSLAASSRYNPHESPRLENAVAYLLATPPKRQIVEQDGSLGWDEPLRDRGCTEVEWLLRLVRRVRNKLFHGGKFPSHLVIDPSRDKMLLDCCLVILSACYGWSSDVQQYFPADD
jgi:hypothetical protein